MFTDRVSLNILNEIAKQNILPLPLPLLFNVENFNYACFCIESYIMFTLMNSFDFFTIHIPINLAWFWGIYRGMKMAYSTSSTHFKQWFGKIWKNCK